MEGPHHERLESIREYVDAIDRVLGFAQCNVRIFDRDLEHLGYNAPGRIELLRAFLLLNRSNRLQVVVHDIAYLEGRCPRMTLLQKQFSHAVQIHQTLEHARHAADPLLLVDDAHYLHRFHMDGSRALLALADPQGAEPLLQRFNEIWDASRPALSATTLGL
ncbi:MAG: hypothetical protein ACOZDY_19360 [Pseudomonadota bacterium]